MKRTLVVLGLVALVWCSVPSRVVSPPQWLAENSGGIVINSTSQPSGSPQTPPPVRPG